MIVNVTRRGKRVRAAFANEGTILEPSLERFAAAVGSLVHSMRAGDILECSFDRVGHMPLVCSRDIDRVVKQASRLPCEVLFSGLPGELAAIYSRYTRVTTTVKPTTRRRRA